MKKDFEGQKTLKTIQKKIYEARINKQSKFLASILIKILI